MVLTGSRRPVGGRRAAPWAWLAIGLAPVVLAVALGAGFLLAGLADTGFSVLLAWVLAVGAVAAALGTPALAVVLAQRALLAGERSATAALAVAALLLVVALLALPMLGYSIGTLVLAVLLDAVAGGAYALWSRRRPA